MFSYITCFYHFGFSTRKMRRKCCKHNSNEAKEFDERGIRTLASEDTSALNWRLRPLGHLATGPNDFNITFKRLLKQKKSIFSMLIEIK
uniref:Uncharacterized protein n=1 Tax=Strongyloides papillosus TaxID=174720 RepID=A0A0N5BT69_STREA